jgi:hypothetical protein
MIEEYLKKINKDILNSKLNNTKIKKYIKINSLIIKLLNESPSNRLGVTGKSYNNIIHKQYGGYNEVIFNAIKRNCDQIINRYNDEKLYIGGYTFYGISGKADEVLADAKEMLSKMNTNKLIYINLLNKILIDDVILDLIGSRFIHLGYSGSNIELGKIIIMHYINILTNFISCLYDLNFDCRKLVRLAENVNNCDLTAGDYSIKGKSFIGAIVNEDVVLKDILDFGIDSIKAHPNSKYNIYYIIKNEFIKIKNILNTLKIFTSYRGAQIYPVIVADTVCPNIILIHSIAQNAFKLYNMNNKIQTFEQYAATNMQDLKLQSEINTIKGFDVVKINELQDKLGKLNALLIRIK